MDYEVWQEVGKELDLKIDFSEEAGWGNFIEGLRTGRYDAFCSQLWADPVRARQLTMSVPVMYSFIDAFVRADDHRFDSDIEKANSPTITIPAIEGDVSVTMAKNRFPSAKIDYLPQTATVSDMFMSVISKKSDIIFVDQGSFLVFNKANPRVLRKLENFPPTFTYAGYYAVMGGELRLRDLIDIALQKMIDDGRMEKLAKKYSTDYKAPHKNFEASK